MQRHSLLPPDRIGSEHSNGKSRAIGKPDRIISDLCDTSSVRAGQNELVFYFISNTTRLDLRFQSHKVQFNSRHLILDPEIIVYDTKKKRFIPDMLHVSCSDDSEISTTVTVHSSIRSKIAVEKITDNTFRLTPLKGLLELSGFKGIEIMTVHVENSDGTLNRNLRVIVNE